MTRYEPHEPLDEYEYLARLLHDEAVRHEPDSVRLREILGVGAQRPEPASPTRSWRRRAVRLVALPAAVTLFGVGTAVAIAQTGPDGQQAARVTVTDSGHPSSGTISGTATSGPGRTTGPTRTGTASSTPRPSTPRTTAVSRVRLDAKVRVSTTVVPDRTRVTLPGSGDRDWIAVGARRDGKFVRAKHAGPTLGTVTVSDPGASVLPGPFDVSWTGGLPEQDRQLSTTWQSVTSAGRMTLTVPAGSDWRSLVLSAGTVRATGVVTVRLAGHPSADQVRAELPRCGQDVCAHMVRIDLADALPRSWAGDDLVVELTAARSPHALGIGLAAVELR